VIRTTQHFTKVICLECQHELATADMMVANCPECGSAWLDAQYDYQAVADSWSAIVSKRDHTLWRYAELLPIEPSFPEVTMGEGFTPLVRLYQYEKMFDHQPIYVKDERKQPTNSFKDRQAALSVMAMRQAGIKECVLASTGNAAVAYAAYCARAGIKLWLFLTSLVPPAKMREASLYGAEVIKVSGTYDETKKVAAAFAKRKGIHHDRGAKAVLGKESMKTLAYEIAEQLGIIQHLDDPNKWVAPDWYIQAVSGGIGPLGVQKGFAELKRMGMIDKVPKLGVIQSAGCAPMVNSFNNNQDDATPVMPKTLITVLATGDPGMSYKLLRQGILKDGGAMVAIKDGETFRAMRQLASKGGISVEPATAVAFAGLEKMLKDGTIQAGETVVVNCSGHTFPVESHILGDQYAEHVLFLPTGEDPVAKEEGLGSALKNLDEQVTSIMIVDDNANDRRLIRRLLQSYKQYRIFESRDGDEALKAIREHAPDLVVSDLTMPERDGFSLLEALKADDSTKHIPVIVVSAKTLTPDDRQRLDKYSASVWQKGGYDTHNLVNHVVDTLGHEPIEVIHQGQPTTPIKPDEPLTDKPKPKTSPLQHTVIVIDDNPQDLRLARRILEADGTYHVIEADTGRDGLKAIYKYHPDLVIVDLLMPDMDGFTIIDAIQDDAHLNDIPIIVYSAKDISQDERARLKDRIRSIQRKSSLDRQGFLDMVNDELISE